MVRLEDAAYIAEKGLSIPMKKFELGPENIVSTTKDIVVYEHPYNEVDVAVTWYLQDDDFEKVVRALCRILQEAKPESARHFQKVHGFVLDGKRGGGVVTELYTKSLRSYIEENLGRADYKELSRRLVVQLLETVREMHRTGLIHRYIEPGNCVVDRDETLVLCGFQKAKLSETVDFGMEPRVEEYVAPEMRLRTDQDVETDAYALGWVLYFIATGEEVTPALKQSGVCKPANDTVLLEIIKGLTQENASSRMQVGDAYWKYMGK